jgi:hypothetical protein
MSPHQNHSLPTYEFHPELGYLCPSHQLRQNVRVGLAAAAFGLITGLAGAMAMLPRHGASSALTAPVLAGAPSGPAGDPGQLPASSARAGASSGSAARVPAGYPDKQLTPAAPMTPAAAAANEAAAAVQTPGAPAVTTDRGMPAVNEQEHVRPEASKRTRRAKANARPRAREPYPTDAWAATSPFGYETRRFSDDTRSARRRDRGSSWSW